VSLTVGWRLGSCSSTWHDVGDRQEYKFDDYFTESFLQAGVSDKSYEEMMSDIQKIYDDYSNLEISDFTDKYQISNYIIRIFKQMKEDNAKVDYANLKALNFMSKDSILTDVRKAFNEYFAPNKFRGLGSGRLKDGFKIVNYSQISEIQEKDSNGNIIKFGNEFWTDSECLIVYLTEYSNPGLIYEKYNELLKLLS
jgi:hypothetical protein